jgi:hypothetical protein
MHFVVHKVLKSHSTCVKTTQYSVQFRYCIEILSSDLEFWFYRLRLSHKLIGMSISVLYQGKVAWYEIDH